MAAQDSLVTRSGGAAALFALAACVPPGIPPPDVSPAPPTRPSAITPEPSPESEAVRRYFATQESTLLARGLLRTDGGGPDTPVSTNMLVENFVRIALYDEYSEIGGRLVGRPSPSVLRRWTAPVRMRMEFDPLVPPAQRRKDMADVRAYAARLSGLTDHPIEVLRAGAAPDEANFHVLVLNEDTRRGYGAQLAELVPGIDPAAVRVITEMPRSVSCLVLAFARSGTSTYSQAIAVIRAELPDLTRLSCYHEELAQGLGLPNDSDDARPSIFNDTEEFALLTTHDELLLRILYDSRLRPGMKETEARPIVRRIASELRGGET
jgi:hypothetical protein